MSQNVYFPTEPVANTGFQRWHKSHNNGYRGFKIMKIRLDITPENLKKLDNLIKLAEKNGVYISKTSLVNLAISKFNYNTLKALFKDN